MVSSEKNQCMFDNSKFGSVYARIVFMKKSGAFTDHDAELSTTSSCQNQPTLLKRDVHMVLAANLKIIILVPSFKIILVLFLHHDSTECFVRVADRAYISSSFRRPGSMN